MTRYCVGMIEYRNCEITFADQVHPKIERGLVFILGESPNATVRICELTRSRRWATIDRLMGATVDTKGQAVRVEGRSEYLTNTVRSSSNRLKVTIKPGKGCENCS